jgi:hypothetical protein
MAADTLSPTPAQLYSSFHSEGIVRGPAADCSTRESIAPAHSTAFVADCTVTPVSDRISCTLSQPAHEATRVPQDIASRTGSPKPSRTDGCSAAVQSSQLLVAHAGADADPPGQPGSRHRGVGLIDVRGHHDQVVVRSLRHRLEENVHILVRLEVAHVDESGPVELRGRAVGGEGSRPAAAHNDDPDGRGGQPLRDGASRRGGNGHHHTSTLDGVLHHQVVVQGLRRRLLRRNLQVDQVVDRQDLTREGETTVEARAVDQS